MGFRCKTCGKVYKNAKELSKGTHRISDVFGEYSLEKCKEDRVYLLPDGKSVLRSALSPKDIPINRVVAGALSPVECNLSNVEYIYPDPYYGQYMKPDGAISAYAWRDINDKKDNIRYAHRATRINGEDAKYRHAYNRAYFGVRPESVKIGHHGQDALVSMTHWAFVDGLFSVGEVQIWISEPGRDIDPKSDEPAIVIYGECEGDKLGIDVRSAGDFDGDGFEELLISAPFHNTKRDDGTVNINGGVVYFLPLGKLDLSQRPLRIRAEDIGRTFPGIRFEGGHDGSRYLGWGLSMDRGHFASKERSSIIIGSLDIYPGKRIAAGRSAPAFPPRVYVLTASSASLPDHIPQFKLGCDSEHYGISSLLIDLKDVPLAVGGMNMTILGIGDIDNDGYEELAITQSNGSKAEGSYIFYGGSHRLQQTSLGMKDVDLTLKTEKELPLGDGRALIFRGLHGATSVNHFDGDGYKEVLFTAPRTVIRHNRKETRIGALGILKGGERRLGVVEFADLDYIIHGEEGRTFSLGKQNSCRSTDITNNGYADILVNDTGYIEDCCGRSIERGRFWLIEGQNNPQRIMSLPSDAKITYLGDIRIPGLFGYGWAIGDYNGDGKIEVAIGDHYCGYQDGKRACGGIFLFKPELTSQPSILLSADTGSLASDLKHAGPFGVEGHPWTSLIFDTRYDKNSDSDNTSAFLDSVKHVSVRDSDIVVGESMDKYGFMIRNIVKIIYDKNYPGHKIEKGIADFIVSNIVNCTKNCEISSKEMLYFLCSSLKRGELVGRIMQQLLPKDATPSLVDHGAALGVLSLAVVRTYGKVDGVQCSEILERYVHAGQELLRSCGEDKRISFANISVSDFSYSKKPTVIFFGQMLLRIPQDQRKRVINAAWSALIPGGLLIINEIMNRSDTNVSVELLDSNELFSYFPEEAKEAYLFIESNSLSLVPLDKADRGCFMNSNNFIVLRKKLDNEKEIFTDQHQTLARHSRMGIMKSSVNHYTMTVRNKIRHLLKVKK